MKTKVLHNVAIRGKDYCNMVYVLWSSTSHFMHFILVFIQYLFSTGSITCSVLQCATKESQKILGEVCKGVLGWRTPRKRGKKNHSYFFFSWSLGTTLPSKHISEGFRVFKTFERQLHWKMQLVEVVIYQPYLVLMIS